MTTKTWHELAYCKDAPLDVFFPGPNAGPNALDLARRYCEACEVRQECLDYVLDNLTSKDDEGGLWAGTTFRQRRVMRRDLKRFRQQLDLLD